MKRDEIMKNVFAALSISVSILICSCGFLGDLFGNGDTNGDLAAIDIVGAKSLFIAPAGASAAAYSGKQGTENTLFKITESGFVQQVTYTDEEGNSTTISNAPSAVHNVNTSFVIVVFGETGSGDNGYLVRKSDGAVFALSGLGDPIKSTWGYINSKIVHTDNSGNIYYLINTGFVPGTGSPIDKLIKIDISDPLALTGETYTPDSDGIYSYQVDPNGNVIYYANWGYPTDYRIKKANGGLYNLPETTNFWIGPDGSIYFYEYTADASQIYKVAIDVSFNVSTTSYGPTLSSNLSQDNYYFMLDLQDRIILVYKGGGAQIVEVNNPTATPRAITAFAGNLIKTAVASSDFYYIAGNDSSNAPVIIKIDPTDDSTTALTTPGEYDVYTMIVTNANNLTFNALRMADGQKVMGTIDSAGVLTIIDEQLNAEVVVLERID